MGFANSCQNERGAVLVISLMFLAILAMLGTTAVVLTTTDMQIGANYKAYVQAFYDADAGVNFGLAKMLEGANADPATFPSDSVSFEDMAIGETTTLTYTVPSGFSFTIDPIEKVASNIFLFISRGTGTNNAQTVIRVGFKPVKNSLFNFGVFGDDSVTLSGNGYSDSYNSNNGPWTGEGVNTNGDIGTNATSVSAVTISGSNAQVYGGTQIGPGGDTDTTITTHSDGQISGSKSCLDEEKDLCCMTCPGGGSADTLSLSSRDTKTFNAGTYNLPSISMTSHGVCTINGDVIFCVSGNISIDGQAEIIISSGASLKIYVSGDVYMAGQGVTNNTGFPENMQIYGTATCGTVNLAGQNAYYGTVFGCAADILLSGQGDVFGAICGETIDMSGQGSVHYDEALQDIGGGGYSALQTVSWERQYE